MDHVMTCLEEISGSGGSNSLRDKYEKYIYIYKITSTNNMVEEVDKVKDDIEVEKGHIVEVVVIHNLVDEIPYRIKVVAVPCLEHSLVEKSLMEEELENFVVDVVVQLILLYY